MSNRIQHELMPAQVADMLDCLNPDCDHDEWKQIGMAIHDWDSGQIGKDLWQQWSMGGEKYDTKAQQAINASWKGFRAGRGIGTGTLVKLAMDAGYRFTKGQDDNESCPRSLARQKTEQQKQEREEDKQRQADADAAAAYARKLWKQSDPARPSHPYLYEHQLPPFDLGETKHKHYGWCLLVPLFNEQGELRSLEYIMAVHGPDGKNKKPIKGTRKKGLFYRFYNPYPEEDPTYTIYICEGWSTGAAIHLSMPNLPSVLCSMSAGNLMAVTEIALRLFPDNQIVIAADHDEAGIKAAYKVAKRFDLEVALPPTPGQDYCDIYINRKKEQGKGKK